MPVDIDGQVAVVTGAAGGMGRAIARAFAAEGRSLILCDLPGDALAATAATLGSARDVATIAGDVTAADFPARILAAAAGRRLAAVAHAAGVSPSMADGPRIFAINFTATRALVEGLLPGMAAGGAIVLIASNSGQMLAHPLLDRAVRRYLARGRSVLVDRMIRRPRTAYPASKRAVQLYVQAMAPVCGRQGVRIVSLSPGIVDTAMGRLEEGAGPVMARMIALTPLARRGAAEEIASAVAFLASPAASYVTGTDLLVDGGTVAGIAAAGGAMRALR